jgi:adenosylcobinamide-phosphate synthase
VRLGGENSYRGEKKVKPSLGDALKPLTEDSAVQTLKLLGGLQVLWLGIGFVLLLLKI